MSELFLTVLNMSLTTSYVIIFIILIRLLLKKAPKVISYALWGVVAFRLIIPFSFESMFSLMPSNTNPVSIPHDIIYQQSPHINSEVAVVDSFVSQSLAEPTIGASVDLLQVFVKIGAYIWVLGIIALLIYSFVSILILRRQLISAQLIEKNIYEAKNLKTPFVIGLFRPKIYIPFGLSAEEKCYIIVHEQTHIRRFDHIVKMVAFLILCIHWFNPLVWIAFLLMSTDLEMSCDERVLKEMGSKVKQAYSTSLLTLATRQHLVNGSPLAFGEGNVKVRIKNILNFKKPAAWVMVVSIMLVAALVIGFASNRPSATNSSDWEVYEFPSYLYDRVTFNTEAEIYPPSFDAINAVLVNQEMETGLTCGKAFTLVKQVEDDWWVVPFAQGLTFGQEAINLPVGGSETYNLTSNMISTELSTGNYRIITDVWYTNEQESVVRTVWADFTIADPDSIGLQASKVLTEVPDHPNEDMEIMPGGLPRVYSDNNELNRPFINAKLLPEVYWATDNKTDLPQESEAVSIPSGRLVFAFLPTRPREEKSIFIDETTLKQIINEIAVAKVLPKSSHIDWAQADFQDYWLNLYVLTDGNVYNRIELWGPIRHKKGIYVNISVMSVDGTHAYESWRIESVALGQILIDTWGPKFDLERLHDVTRIDMRVLNLYETTKVGNKVTLEGDAAKNMAERMLNTAKVITGYGKCGYNIELCFTFSDGTTELGWLNGDSCTGIAMEDGPNIMFDKEITRELYKLLDYGEGFIQD
ncbi:MAG: hypothetical protein GX270_02635 [Clostridiaceae bacterium]|nr:hypothetical protein [Clostridiaceae bacterium]